MPPETRPPTMGKAFDMPFAKVLLVNLMPKTFTMAFVIAKYQLFVSAFCGSFFRACFPSAAKATRMVADAPLTPNITPQ